MKLGRLGYKSVHLSALDYPTITAHFITDYQTPAVDRPHARCGVSFGNRDGNVVVMNEDVKVTCVACKRILAAGSSPLSDAPKEHQP